MTEDRLTHLLAEATDLAPSPTLRDRVERASLPLPSGRETLGLRGLTWFALSGAAATLAAVAFLAIPREATAAELVRKAGRAVRANLTFRTEYEDHGGGRWRVQIRGLTAPGWQLATWNDGRFQLHRPGAHYVRFDLDGPIRMTRRFRNTPEERAAYEDPSPENHVRLLRSVNPGRDEEFGLALGRTLEEDGRRLREVVITEPMSDWMRTRYLIDEATDLPARMEGDVRVDGEWRLNSRTTFTFPGPAAGSEAFTRPLRTAPIVDVDVEEARWTRRLARVRRVLRPPHGEPLAVRDLRTLPSGEVVMLYTGPQRVLASLEGPRGEPFALCRSVAWATLYPDRRHVVRLLHFVPLRADAPIAGPLRLQLTWGGRPNGAFQFDAPLQSATRPPWATAMNAPFGREGESLRERARVGALADRWLDAGGRPLKGSFSQDPSAELRTVGMSGLTAPKGAVRPDPKASAEAAVLMRRLTARLAAKGEQEDPFWTDRLLKKLDRHAQADPH